MTQVSEGLVEAARVETFLLQEEKNSSFSCCGDLSIILELYEAAMNDGQHIAQVFFPHPHLPEES